MRWIVGKQAQRSVASLTHSRSYLVVCFNTSGAKYSASFTRELVNFQPLLDDFFASLCIKSHCSFPVSSMQILH
jgi:hypothetical protein